MHETMLARCIQLTMHGQKNGLRRGNAKPVVIHKREEYGRFPVIHGVFKGGVKVVSFKELFRCTEIGDV